MISKKQKKNIEKNTRRLPLSGNLYKRNKRRISFSKLFKLGFLVSSFIFIMSATFYMIFLNNKINAESINQETVLSELKKSIILPEYAPEKMFRVAMSKDLSTQNDFYRNVKNGEYVVVYDKIMIIYDFENKIIKNIWTKK